jgi:hypothetical protein
MVSVGVFVVKRHAQKAKRAALGPLLESLLYVDLRLAQRRMSYNWQSYTLGWWYGLVLVAWARIGLALSVLDLHGQPLSVL